MSKAKDHVTKAKSDLQSKHDHELKQLQDKHAAEHQKLKSDVTNKINYASQGHQTAISKLNGQKSEVDNNIAAIESNNTVLKTSIDNHANHIQKVKDIKETSLQNIKSSQDSHLNSSTLRSKAINKIQDSQKAFNISQQAIKSRLSEEASLENEIKSKKLDESKLTAKETQAKQILEKTEKQLEEHKSQLSKEESSERQEKSELESEKEKHKGIEANISSNKLELSNAELSLKGLHSQISMLQSQGKSMGVDNTSQIDALKSTLATDIANKTELAIKLKQLLSESEASKQKVARLEGHIKEYARKILSSKSAEHELNKRIAQVNSTIKQLNGAQKSANDLINSLSEKVTKTNSAINVLRSSANTFLSANQEGKVEKNTHETDIVKHQNTINSASMQVKEADTQIAKHTNEKLNMEKQHEVNNSKIKLLKSKSGELEEVISKHKAEEEELAEAAAVA